MKLILPKPTAPADALHEQARLNALLSYNVLDTEAEQSFDRVTRLSKRVFNVSMTTVTFLDGHRQWFKSQQGLSVCETDRDVAFCDIAIRQPNALIVNDARDDPRFADNPFVRGEPHIRFYAGFQLRAAGGHAIGTLCVMDPQPRTFSQDDEAVLAELGGLTVDLLELRKQAHLSKPSTNPPLSAIAMKLRRRSRSKGGRGVGIAESLPFITQGDDHAPTSDSKAVFFKRIQIAGLPVMLG